MRIFILHNSMAYDLLFIIGELLKILIFLIVIFESKV